MLNNNCIRFAVLGSALILLLGAAPLTGTQPEMPIDCALPHGIAFDLVRAERFDGKEIVWRGMWIDFQGSVHLYRGPDSLRLVHRVRPQTSQELWADRFNTMDTVVARIAKPELDSMVRLTQEAAIHPVGGLLEHPSYLALEYYSAYLPSPAPGESPTLLLYLDAGADRIRMGKPSRAIQMWLWRLWERYWEGKN